MRIFAMTVICKYRNVLKFNSQRILRRAGLSAFWFTKVTVLF